MKPLFFAEVLYYIPCGSRSTVWEGWYQKQKRSLQKLKPVFGFIKQLSRYAVHKAGKV